MGFTKLMLAFYDQPELLHRMNQELLDFNLAILERIGRIGRPTFMTIAEDMSYNNGPMISRGLMDEFMAPYYKKLLARAKEMEMLTIVDTDGDVTLLVPWLLEQWGRRRAATGTAGGRRWDVPAHSVPQPQNGRPLRQDGHAAR